MNVVERTEGVRAPPSVGRSLKLSPKRVFDVSAGVCVCLCVHACVRGRSYATVGGGWNNMASGR